MAESGIYRITNTVDGKQYVGQSIDIDRRLSEHRSKLRSNTHRNAHLQSAWNAHGEHSFLFETVMIITDRRCLDSAEEGWFYLTKCCDRRYGYNYSKCPGANRRGMVATSKTRAKLSAARRLRPPPSPETRAKVSASLKGRPKGPVSDVTRAKLSAALTGVKLSPYHRARIAEGARRRHAREREEKASRCP